MKPLLFTTLFFAINISSYSQDVEELKANLFVTEQITAGVDTVQSDFETEFKQTEDKRNFKKLREYLDEKNNILEVQKKLKESFNNLKKDLEKDLENIRSGIKTLKIRTSPLQDTTKIAIESYFAAPNISKYFDEVGVDIRGEKIKKDLIDIYPKLDSVVNYVSYKLFVVSRTIDLINWNMLNISSDISTCLYTIDNALAPEYRSLAMKINLGYMALAIFGISLLGILVGLLTKILNKENLELVFGDGGLQFFTIFTIMIAIILFGLLNILEGRELAAILGAISGYILGRGTRQKKEKKEASSVLKETDENKKTNA